jgi:hypothetical protein
MNSGQKKLNLAETTNQHLTLILTPNYRTKPGSLQLKIHFILHHFLITPSNLLLTFLKLLRPGKALYLFGYAQFLHPAET